MDHLLLLVPDALKFYFGSAVYRWFCICLTTSFLLSYCLVPFSNSAHFYSLSFDMSLFLFYLLILPRTSNKWALGLLWSFQATEFLFHIFTYCLSETSFMKEKMDFTYPDNQMAWYTVSVYQDIVHQELIFPDFLSSCAA